LEEISLFLDKECKKEIFGKVEFETIDAGVKTISEIFVKNNLNFNMNVVLKLEGEFIKLNESIDELKPKEIKKVIFEFNPKITAMSPINAKLKIKLDYVIR